jgi:hypothetical protein
LLADFRREVRLLLRAKGIGHLAQIRNVQIILLDYGRNLTGSNIFVLRPALSFPIVGASWPVNVPSKKR